MKLIELDAPTTPRRRRPELVPGFAAKPIRVTRLPRGDGSKRPEPREIAVPPALVIATEGSRRVRLKHGAALLLAMVLVALLWALIDSGTGGSTSSSHPVPVRLTPAQERSAASARARAAAIAQARRDRGTDAELEDTIPPPTSGPGPRAQSARG